MRPTLSHEEFRALLAGRVTPHQLFLIDQAYGLSKYGHRGQMRDSGERYFEHPKRVALILICELEIFDTDMIVAALLHYIVEDSFILGSAPDAFSGIALHFGERAASFVRLLTKEQCSCDAEKIQRDVRYFTAIEHAEPEAQIIKCGDRLDNLRDIDCCTAGKKRHYLDETRAHFLPMVQSVAPQLYDEFFLRCNALESDLATCQRELDALTAQSES